MLIYVCQSPPRPVYANPYQEVPIDARYSNTCLLCHPLPTLQVLTIHPSLASNSMLTHAIKCRHISGSVRCCPAEPYVPVHANPYQAIPAGQTCQPVPSNAFSAHVCHYVWVRTRQCHKISFHANLCQIMSRNAGYLQQMGKGQGTYFSSHPQK